MHDDKACVDHTPWSRKNQPLLSVPAAPLVEAVSARGLTLAGQPVAAQRAFWRAKRAGRVTLAAADKLAHDLLDEHPSSLWGDAWWTVQ